MSTPSVLIGQLVNDFECVTLAVLTETLGIPCSSAVETLLEFVKGRDDLKLIYSVCYIDEDNDIVLSHKSEDELAGLNGRYRDVKSALLGICKGTGEEYGGVTQTCWRHELDIVEKELKKSSENGSLYIPSYATIQCTDKGIRNYERIKQGDSSLCAPIHKPQPSATTPVPPVHASAPSSAAKRGTAGIADFFKGGNMNTNGPHKQTKLGVLHSETGLSNVDTGDVTVPPELTTSESNSMVEDTPEASENVNKRASHDIKPALPQESQRPCKRERIVSKEEPARQSNEEAEMPSLFDCDAPCDAMELDEPSCNDGPVTYVEKVTKENTYVDSGYFVVEETNEYVQVTAATKAEAPTSSKCDLMTMDSAEGRKGLLKKRQNSLNQSTLMSFFNR